LLSSKSKEPESEISYAYKKKHVIDEIPYFIKITVFDRIIRINELFFLKNCKNRPAHPLASDRDRSQWFSAAGGSPPRPPP